MTDLGVMKHAKGYMEKLSRGIDPISGSAASHPEGRAAGVYGANGYEPRWRVPGGLLQRAGPAVPP